MQNSLPTNTTSISSNEVSVKEQILRYFQYWRWFLLSVLVCLSVVFIFLRYYVVEYGVASSILIKDEKKGGDSEYSAFGDINIITAKNNIANEIAMLKSRRLSQNVVRNLDLDISYFTKGRLVSRELYGETNPIKIIFLDKKENYYEKDTVFTIKIQSKKSFILSNIEKKGSVVYKFGQKINSTLGNFIVTLNSESIPNKGGNEIIIHKINLESRANYFRGNLTLSNIEKTNVINLSATDPIWKRGVNYLDSLVSQYNQDAIKDRNLIAEFTKEFIEKRLRIITDELGGIDGKEESFKKDKKITSVEDDAKMSLQNQTDFTKSLIAVETDIKVSEFMLDEVNNTKINGLIATNILSSTETSTALIKEYNAIALDRERISKTSTEKNPLLRDSEDNIKALRANILESLHSRYNALLIQRDHLLRQRNVYDGRIAQAPTNERLFNEIFRQQQIKQNLYLYLLQKREEAEISLAATSPKAKIIDKAYLTGSVTLNRNVFYLGAFLLGLFIPFGILFLIDFLDTKIKNRYDIIGKISVPYLGDLPKSENNEEIIKVNSRSSSAEAIRMIRTNLDFMLAHVSANKCKTIFVTSSIPKEGKTFIAVNLAATIALSGRKVLIIGLDIRNPKLDTYIDLPLVGLTNYLSKSDSNINDYIVKVKDVDNFYALPSGVIPPNPVELLMNDKIHVMFNELKQQYDYIIVDTAPTSVVTDTLLIAKNADSVIYVMRANYLDKGMLSFAETLYKENKLPNMSVLLNDTEIKKTYYGYGYGYGNGYGYGYGYTDTSNPTFFEKIVSFFKRNKK
jgi:capsular exopolysaccharide synthesis family protein